MKRLCVSILLSALLLSSCASTGSGSGLSLQDAIEQTGEKIAGELPAGSRVAIVAFESESDNLSDYIMEELTGALFDRGIEVADRQNLEYVYKELDFQMSGVVSDETAKSIGKFLAADMVITGELIDLDSMYRYHTNAISVETAVRASVTRLDVRSDNETRRMITALVNRQTTVKTANYGVSADTTPKTAGTFIDRGILFASRGDYEMAIADFSEALSINPNLSAAYALRGRALVASVSKVTSVGDNFSSIVTASVVGRNASAEEAHVYEQAIADFTQAIRLDPDNVKSYRERGNAYRYKGDIEKAIADFNQAIRLDPNNAHAYNNRGNAYLDKNDYDRAIADYDQAIRLDPNYDIAYNNRGNVYRDKGDIEKAIADFNQAIRLDPNYAPAYINRGNAYKDKGDIEKAIADYDQAIRLDPNYAPAYINRGIVYYDKGDIEKAIADYDQAIRLDPNNAPAYNNRGNAYLDKNDYDRAIADYDQAIRLNPNYAEAYSNRGLAYSDKNDYDRAIADYTQAIRLNPNFADAYNNRGLEYYDKRDYDRAIADYEAALRINPNHAYAKTNLENARRARGR